MSPNQTDKIVSLKEQGKTWREIGQDVGISGNAARKRYYRQIKIGGTNGNPASEPEVTIIGATADDDAGLTIDEIWKAAFNAQTRVENYIRTTQAQQIIIEPPCALALTSDLHFGNARTDYRTAKRDAEIIRDTPGMFAGFCGDGVDNWIVGKLAQLQRKQAINFDAEWQMFFNYLEILKNSLLFVVAGNHDNWTHKTAGIDRVADALQGAKVLYHPQQVLFKLEVGQDLLPVKARHKWPYGSVYNTTHSIEVGWERGGDDFIIGIGGHTHQGTFFRPFERHGIRRLACLMGTYKIHDSFGEELGKGKPYGTGCGAIVFDGEGRMFDTDNLEMAVKVLDAIR